MPKKPPKNGYFYFMLNFKRRAENHGHSFPGGLQEVAVAASEEWKALPSFRRDYFNQIAKERRNDPRPNKPKPDEKRFNCQGISFAELKMVKDNATERMKQQNQFIERFVNQMNLGDLRGKLIYLIHVNIFCKTDKDVYYPAEIAMVKFNLSNGLKGIFHRYIDPGEIAPGYSYEVKQHADLTHKLTPQFVRSVDGSSDFDRLYGEICKFLSEDEKYEGILPPLFTMYDDLLLNSSLDAVKGMFRSLWAHVHSSHDQDDNSWESIFKVLPLPDMFFNLKNRCMAVTNPNTLAFPNAVLAKKELEKDTYHYELDSSCKFHRDEDVVFHCSQSFVLRWVYIIRDHCADLIGVDLFPKYILPKIEIKEEIEEEFYDNMSTTDSQYSSSYSQISFDFPKYMKPETNRFVTKQERDLFYNSGRKRERNGDDYVGANPIKREKSADGYTTSGTPRQNQNASYIKSEKDFIDSLKREKYYDSTKMLMKHEKIDPGKINEEKCQLSFLKQEKDASCIKSEREIASCSYVSPVKQEKNADFLKQEADSKSIKQENDIHWITDVKCTTELKLKKHEDIKDEKENVVDSSNGRVKDEKVDPGYDDW